MEFNETTCKSWWIIVPPSSTKTLKLALENWSLYDHKRKITHLHNDNKMMAIPVTSRIKEIIQTSEDLKELMQNTSAVLELKDNIDMSSKNQKTTPRGNLLNNLRDLFQSKGLVMTDSHVREVPKNWEKHGNLVLLPESSFTLADWGKFGNELWVVVAQTLGVKRLGRKSTIIDNNYRSPKVTLLLGENSWVEHIDNGITYSYNVTKCMFSSGNITEKIRVGNFNCGGLTVVDLYAGIGYFVLPYLVKAGAKLVYACEWNPDSVEALRKNVELNGVKDKCVIIQGDNRQFPYSDVADHVNLGLIPSSEAAWPVACSAIKKDVGGWLHIHGNVTSYNTNTQDVCEVTSHQTTPTCNRKIKHKWLEWCTYVIHKVKELLVQKTPFACHWQVRVEHIEHVKSYAPHVDHLVLDVKCQPTSL